MTEMSAGGLERNKKMASKNYIRTITAGRYRKMVKYSRALPSDTKTVRLAKQVVTSKAQQFINIKNATENIQMLMCANFDKKNACFCTFTFETQHLPANRKHLQNMFTAFLKNIRQEWHRQGRELKYIYTIEGEPLTTSPNACPPEHLQWEIAPWKDAEQWEMLDSGAQKATEQPIRFHAHCFLLLNKMDYDTVRSFWSYGYVYINQMKVNEITTFSRLAAYVTKDCRNGKKPNGARAYVPSLNLEKPKIEGHWCEEYETIEPPRGAEVIHSGREDTMYTSFLFCYYRLPRLQQPSQPYASKGKPRFPSADF